MQLEVWRQVWKGRCGHSGADSWSGADYASKGHAWLNHHVDRSDLSTASDCAFLLLSHIVGDSDIQSSKRNVGPSTKCIVLEPGGSVLYFMSECYKCVSYFVVVSESSKSLQSDQIGLDMDSDWKNMLQAALSRHT